MAAALELIKSSLRLIGAIATGETPSADEANDGLAALNDLLESWSTERLAVYRSVEIVHPLFAGVATYTIGPGADIDTARPIRITGAFLRWGTLDTPIRILEDEEWNALRIKSAPGVTERLRYRPGFPVGAIDVWPVPTIGELHLTTDMQFTRLESVSDEVSLPPGYERALRYVLATELAPEFGVAPRPDVIAIAAAAKAGIKRANKRAQVAAFDPALTGRGTVGGLAGFLGGN